MAKKRTVRQRIRIYCAEHDMTQGELAAKLGMSEKKMSLVLSGRAVPNIKELAQLETLLGLSARDFARVA